ncbi:MAG: hypothetical protein DSZ29_03495 [Aquificaceae bacterium]|nr:MAG: hypothetical protein DSZ29_03495 [Aquificaceae bacterium]
MKYSITKIIAASAFGLIISSAAIASEEDYGEDVYTPTAHVHMTLVDNIEDSGNKPFLVNSHDNHSLFENDVSVIDMNYSSNQ